MRYIIVIVGILANIVAMATRPNTLLPEHAMAPDGTAPSVALADSLAPDPEDEDYITDTIAKTPRNISEGQNVMQAILEARYRGFNEEFEQKKWWHHSFVGAGFGMQKLIENSGDTGYTPLTMLNLNYGKMFTPWHTLRFNFGGGQGFQKEYEQYYYKLYFGIDYLFNLTAYSKGYNPMRKLEVQYLIGASGQYSQTILHSSLFAPEIHTGFQFKIYAGPYGYVTAEPYVGIIADKADYSKNNWRRYDIFTGINIGFAHYLNNNLSARQREAVDDYAPFFFEASVGGNMGKHGEEMSFMDALGHEYNLAVGKWLSSGFGVRASVYHSNDASSMVKMEADPDRHTPEYTNKYYTNHAGVRLEAMINPFGFKNVYDWDNTRYGMYLTAGVGYGWLQRCDVDKYLLRTHTLIYSGGLHFWTALNRDMQFFVEPRISHYTHRIPYSDSKKYAKSFEENNVSVNMGLTMFLRSPRFRRQDEKLEKEISDSLYYFHNDDIEESTLPLTFGIAGLTAYPESSAGSITDDGGMTYGGKLFVQYRFNPISSARFTAEYISFCRSAKSRYYDIVTQGDNNVYIERDGIFKHRNGLLLSTINYVCNLNNLLSGYSKMRPRHKGFGAELFVGAGLTTYLSDNATISSKEQIQAGHSAVAVKHVNTSHFTIDGGIKLYYMFSHKVSAFFEPSLYLINDLKMPGYTTTAIGQFRYFQSLSVGAQYAL